MRILLTSLLLAAACGAPAVERTPAVAAARPVDVPLALTDLAGASLDLEADLTAGRPVVLVFWQTWCAACRREAPELAAAARAHAGRLAFVGVVPGGEDLVDPAELARTADEWGLPYPTVHDADLRLTRAFDVQGTPTIVVLGPGRELLYRGHQPPDWSELLR